MLAKRAVDHRLPATPQPLGRLIEASFLLWLASWRACLGPALLYGLAGLLPALSLGALTAALWRESLGIVLEQLAPWLPRPGGGRGDPLALFEAGWDWLATPSTWSLLALSTLGMCAAASLVLHRQLAFADGAPARPRALAALPAMLGAWIAYLLLLGLALLPLAALAAGLWTLAPQLDAQGLLLAALLFFGGGLVLSIPLAWVSVAAGFAPLAAATDGAGPLRAQTLSARRVRGHWVHAALAITVPLLVYLGVGSLVSSLALLLAGSVAWSLGGWAELMRGAWLGWAQWIALLPMAAAFPLATAALVAVWNDLSLRVRRTVAPGTSP